MECEYCLDTFNTNDLLEKHNNEPNSCSKYKNILFTCKKCNFKTVGIKNIDKHINNNCLITETSSNNDILLNRIEKKIDEILKYTKIKKNNKVDLLDKQEEKIIEKNLSDIPNINLYINNKLSEIKNDSITNSSSSSISHNKKIKYKILKNQIELRTENLEDEKNKIFSIFNDVENKKKIFLENINTANIFFNDCFTSIIKNKRLYNKNFENIKNTRLKLIDFLSYDSYIELIESHIKNLNIIFKDKDCKDKKIIENISKCMNNIDLRLVYYGNYYDTPLEVDEIEKLKKSLQYFNATSTKDYIPFNIDNFFKKFFNYGSVIFTLKDNIECYIKNIYGKNNIVYVPIKNSTLEDPYSFYYLENIYVKKNIQKRIWKMDCRLEYITKNFIINIKNYLIKIFRKLYYDIFKDNDYRKDYKNTNIVTEYDCQQLIDNIFILCDFKSFSFLLRNIIIQHCTYIPSINDGFNLCSDDTYQKRKFNKLDENDNKDILFDTVKLLFDNISNEDAVDFYRKSE